MRCRIGRSTSASAMSRMLFASRAHCSATRIGNTAMFNMCLTREFRPLLIEQS